MGLADLLHLVQVKRIKYGYQRSSTGVTHSEVFEGTCILNVGEGGLEVFELRVDLLCRLLRLGHLIPHNV